MMRHHSKLWLLLPLALACSEGGSAPTEVKPEFAPMCVPPKAKVVAGPPVTRVKNTTFGTKFTVSNPCTVGLALEFTASRTGAVASVVNPTNPATAVLAPGTSKAVFVTYRTGSPGNGTVVLTATTDDGASSFGVLQVTVTN